MYTLGVEEEIFVIDQSTYALTSLTDADFFTRCSQRAKATVKGEYYNCQIELNTPTCKNIKELAKHYSKLRSIVFEEVNRLNLDLLATSTHPFSNWRSCIPTVNKRYETLENELKDAMRRLLVCSVQFHVSVPDLSLRHSIINVLRQYLPHLLSLSSSSPFWIGRNTGLMSYRTLVAENLPRSHLPPFFTNMKAYEHYEMILKKTHSILSSKEIWWDVRAHPFFPTIECRICDNPTSKQDIIALTALYQAMVSKIHKMVLNGFTPNPEQHVIDYENKWRAARYGIDGSFIDLEKEEETPIKKAIIKLLEWVEKDVAELKSTKEIQHIYTMMERESSASLQIAAYKDNDDFSKVIKEIKQRQTD